MRLAVVFLLLAALRLHAAVGDLIGLEIETNGWVLRATIAGLNTNGHFYSGLGTNNSLGAEKLKLQVLTPGFNQLGVSQYIADASIATTNLRAPYPMQNTNDYQPQGDDVVIRVALSRKINTNEVVTATALVGYYAVTNGTGTNANAFTSQTVTNNSTNVWEKVIAGWAYPGFQVITGNTYQLSVVAFQADARNGSPVAAVRFWNEDSAGNRTTQLVSQATWHSDGCVLFTANMDASTMTQGAVVTNNFIAYPWVGISPHVSADYNARGTNALLNALIGSNFYLCDKNGTYGRSAAAVDDENGNDSTGKVITNLHFSASSPPAPFETIGAAHNAIAASNNIWYSRNDAGYGEIYLTNGLHTWARTTTTGNRPDTWVNVRGWPGVDRSLVIISNAATELDLSDFVHLSSCTITSTAVTFTGVDNLWSEDVVFNSVQSAFFNVCSNVWFTRCKIERISGPNSGSGLPSFRGCEISPVAAMTLTAQMFIGNWQTSSTANAVGYQMATAAIRPRPVTIFAFNRMACQTNATGSAVSFDFPITQYASDYIGAAFVQNLWEAIRENSGAISFGSLTTSSNLWNCLCWNNTTVGQKCNWFYTGTTARRDVWFSSSILNNLWDEHSIKTDDLAGGENGDNIGNWAIYHGVGSEGNVFPETINVGAPGSFLFRFPGLNTWQAGASGTTNTYLRYTDRQAYAVTNDFGNGNYRLLSDSPAFRNLKTRWVLPFDIEGKARSAIDPPGAYVAGNARKGAFF